MNQFKSIKLAKYTFFVKENAIKVKLGESLQRTGTPLRELTAFSTHLADVIGCNSCKVYTGSAFILNRFCLNIIK